MKKIILILAFISLLAGNVYALDLARVKSWSAAEILTAADLNAEFNNITNHAISNSDVSATAGILASKLNQAVAGAIGATTPNTGAFTTLSATGNTTLGNGADTVTFNSSSGITYTPAATWTFTAAQTVSGTWANLGTVTTADINGGTIDGVTIGASSAPTITNLGTVATSGAITTGGKLTAGANEIEGSNFDITGGTMSGVQIGGTTATGEIMVNDASDDADGLGSQGTAGQFLQSAGAGANPTWASAMSQVNDVETTGVSFDDDPEVTVLSVAKTITSGNTVLLMASGYVAAGAGGATASTIKLKSDSTIVQTIVTAVPVSTQDSWSVCAIVTSLSGSVTFSVTMQGSVFAATGYGNLVVLEFS
jgi:hypothetical protein